MQPSRTAQSTPPQSNTDQADNEEKRKLIAEKTKELEQVTRLNVISEDLVAYLKKLSSNSNELSKGAEEMTNIVKGWDDTIMIMGLTTKEKEKKNELFRYVKE